MMHQLSVRSNSVNLYFNVLFCIDDNLPDHVRVTHKSLFDGTVQGIELDNAPAYGFQGHPEASPGPHDVAPLFDHFIHLMQDRSLHAS